MNLENYKWPEVNQINLAFPTFDTIPELLEEAEKRGFLNGSTKANKKFSELFFKGGSVNTKENLTENQIASLKYAKALMGSFAPKHEHKEAVCAMIFDYTLIL